MDEDAEFRDIIIHNLEQKGVLQKMRAQLRAHIYHLIDEDRATDANANPPINAPNSESPPLPSDETTATSHAAQVLCATVDDVIAINLVQDMLDCLQLSYTSSMLKSELKSRTNLNWSRRKIAAVLQLELDDAADTNTASHDYSEDTFNEISSGSLPNGNDHEQSTASNQSPTRASVSVVQDTTKSGEDAKKTPLLVEILRRLPKTTDESSSNKSTNETMGEMNNETFVTAPRSTNNQLSESF